MFLDTQGYGTGALRHRDDPRDHLVERIPRVATALSTPIMRARNWRSFTPFIYNQGPLPSCVAHSSAAMKTLQEVIDQKIPIRYDAERLYWENGGDGKRGVPTLDVLKYAKEKGIPELEGPRIHRIESYAFTRDPMVICTGLSLDVPLFVVFAMLLPTDFWKGECQTMEISDSYHQVLAVGYDLDQNRIYFQNSWGSGYGQGGFGSVPISYLTQLNNQQGAFYAYAVTDVRDRRQEPDPLQVIVGCTQNDLPIKTIHSGMTFSIVGKGFGPLQGVAKIETPVLWEAPLTITSWTDTLVTVVAPRAEQVIAPAIVTLSGGQIRKKLEYPGLRFEPRESDPSPTPATPKIAGYLATRESPSSAFSEGSQIKILFDQNSSPKFLHRPMRIFWGSIELEITGLKYPNQIGVRAPEVDRTTTNAIRVELQDGAREWFVGPAVRILNAAK